MVMVNQWVPGISWNGGCVKQKCKSCLDFVCLFLTIPRGAVQCSGTILCTDCMKHTPAQSCLSGLWYHLLQRVACSPVLCYQPLEKVPPSLPYSLVIGLIIDDTKQIITNYYNLRQHVLLQCLWVRSWVWLRVSQEAAARVWSGVQLPAGCWGFQLHSQGCWQEPPFLAVLPSPYHSLNVLMTWHLVSPRPSGSREITGQELPWFLLLNCRSHSPSFYRSPLHKSKLLSDSRQAAIYTQGQRTAAFGD